MACAPSATSAPRLLLLLLLLELLLDDDTVALSPPSLVAAPSPPLPPPPPPPPPCAAASVCAAASADATWTCEALAEAVRRRSARRAYCAQTRVLACSSPNGQWNRLHYHRDDPRHQIIGSSQSVCVVVVVVSVARHCCHCCGEWRDDDTREQREIARDPGVTCHTPRHHPSRLARTPSSPSSPRDQLRDAPLAARRRAAAHRGAVAARSVDEVRGLDEETRRKPR